MLDQSFFDAAGLVGQYSATEAVTIGQHGLERMFAHTADD
jgi:hypothetical protein